MGIRLLARGIVIGALLIGLLPPPAAMAAAASPPAGRVAAAPASAAGELAWYFAEGYTGPGFDEYLTIMNPNPAAAQVRITYYLGGGRAPVTRTLTAPPSHRTTVAVHDAAQGVGRNREVSAKVESTNGVGIIVERPIYFTYAGGAGAAVTGGHVVLGATAPRPTWLFAEGYTGAGFDQYLTILNPNPTDVAVTITYYLGAGQAPVTKAVTAPANARVTVAVHDAAQGVGRDREVAAAVEAAGGAGIVVERPMYFTYAGGMGAVTGGHAVLGAAQPRRRWLFAEGYTGAGFDEYLTILNPNPTDADVTITYYLGGGGRTVATLAVAAASRRTVAVHETAYGVGRGREVAAEVTTAHAGGVVVERPMYFNYAGSMGTATGGHAVVGAGEPATSWSFAEGYTGTGFDEYLTILNPGPLDAAVTLTYFLSSGAPVTRALTARANARATVAVHDGKQGVGRGKQVSARIEATNGVGLVVERPMYFRYAGAVDGGHAALGHPATAAIDVDGEWVGSARGNDNTVRPLSFTVERGAITVRQLQYGGFPDPGGCGVAGGIDGPLPTRAPIVGNAIRLAEDRADLAYVFRGTVAAGPTASGVLEVTLKPTPIWGPCAGALTLSWAAARR